MRKKIAIVDNSTWNIYNFRQPLIKRLKEEGHQVIVIAPVDEYIHYLNDHCFSKHLPLKNLSPQRKHPGQDLLLMGELYRIFRREKPDLILTYTIKPNIYGNLAARMAGIPAVATITGLGYTFLNDGLVNRLVPHLYRLAFRHTRRVVFYNTDDCRLFRQRRLVVPSSKGVVIPGSGVDTGHFRPAPPPDSDRFVFLFIGRLLYDKGLREFVEAARRLRHRYPLAECWVIGEVSPQNPAAVAKSEVVRWMEQDLIQYWGVAKDVRPYIRRAGAVVLPSYREGIPRSLLEGMAMGKPIITTDAPGCRDTVEAGRNGFLTPPRDAAALARAMERMLLLPAATREAMGVYSRQKAKREFEEKIITAHYAELVREVMGHNLKITDKKIIERS